MTTSTIQIADDGGSAEWIRAADDVQTVTRREFLTYAWGASLALLAMEGTVAAYFFLLPRFGAGEFGGEFLLGPAGDLPVEDRSTPVAHSEGKFWLVHTDEGVKALYMICTHLGCLYKWSESSTRFECPCHGSKFTLNGDYIEGPAPRSLDQFEIRVIEDGHVVAVTQETPEGIIPPPISAHSGQVVVDTGKRILGKPAEQSPARRA